MASTMHNGNTENRYHNDTDDVINNRLQPIIYGVLPERTGDEIELSELFSRLVSQWKRMLGITMGGSLLAVILALLLPSVYRPAITVSMPSAGDIMPIVITNTLLGGNNAIPATPQVVFKRYFNLLRSDKILAKYLEDNQYLRKIYPDAFDKEAGVDLSQLKSKLFANLQRGLTIDILEPKPAVKRDYVGQPERIQLKLDVPDETTGVSLLNGYAAYVNHHLMSTLQTNAQRIINGRLNVLTQQLATQREQHRQSRLLMIEKMESDNNKAVAQFRGQIEAAIKKAALSRKTRIANATEALNMAKTLGVINPSTMDAMAKKGLKNKEGGTSITVVDKQSIPLYLYGTKYLTTLIESLKNRKNDAVFMNDINELEKKINLIQNDKTLAALKIRQSDDPWIGGLADELAKIKAIKNLKPDFSHVDAYILDNPAIVTGKAVKPKRALIVVLGFILSLFVAIFVALVMGKKT